jgi:hypothetical protein
VGEIMPIKCKKLDIINRSMLLIKKSPITDLDEDSEVASYVRFLYPVVTPEIIESYPFACAISCKNLISVHGGDNNKEYKYKANLNLKESFTPLPSLGDAYRELLVAKSVN